MGRFMKGDVVVISYPFSDLSRAKRRPALVVAAFPDDEDVIVCPITSHNRPDAYALTLDTNDFASGGLRLASYIRPHKLFTADAALIAESVGRVTPEKLKAVIGQIVAIFQG